MTLRQSHQDAVLLAADAARLRQVLVTCSDLLSWAEANCGAQFAAAAQEAAQAAGFSRAPRRSGRRGEPGHRHAGLLRCSTGRPVSGPAAPPLPAELDALLRRMRLPYLRKAAPDVLAAARAQRWEPAEVLRVLLAEEVTGRNAATGRMRRKTVTVVDNLSR